MHAPLQDAQEARRVQRSESTHLWRQRVHRQACCRILARRNIPFYMAGRTRTRLEAALKVVEERRGAAVDAEIAVAGNTAEELLPCSSRWTW